MNQIDVHIRMEAFGKDSLEAEVLANVVAARLEISRLIEAEKYMEALERTITALQRLKDFPDHENEEFKAILVALIFDLAEIHYELKDFKRSEKELDALFKVLDPLLVKNPDRFGRLHILAMELSTRILRSKKKTIDMLARQQLNVDALTEKVNAGINSATDRLVDSLCNVGRLLASSGDYREAMKFFSEAIRISKKRTGKVNKKEIKMTAEMAEIMIRVKSMRPRAERLLDAVLPHAIAQGEADLEQQIHTLKEMIKLQENMKVSWLSAFRTKKG
ncbi:MAG: tetratricopeptide repeat protein [Muribaculaceae bacterium]|nr:tetratricopeptide repeat protein [Muribaculaceae bacterium]MDE6552566.1 tetratricopeptide repeat protein [Muribaculaceae bacterium]